jgi:hypothetical protein
LKYPELKGDIMTNQWTWAAVLSCALTVGCGDGQPETTQNQDLGAPAVSTEQVGVAEPGVADTPAPASPRRDGPAVTGTTTRPSATSGVDREPSTSLRAEAPRREAPVESAPPAPRWRDVTVPAGTALPLELLTAISSETAALETPVRARLRQAVVVDDYTALPAGTVLHGNVTDVDRAGRIRGRARLAFRFTEAEVDGGREELRTNPVSFEGEATKGEDATKIGAGAVGGAIIGGILGGGDGAAKGAAIGGAAGTGAVLATRGREVSLAAGTDIAASLASPYSARVSVR